MIDIHFFKKGELESLKDVKGFIRFTHDDCKRPVNVTYGYEDFCENGDLVTYEYVYENGKLTDAYEIGRDVGACEFAITDEIDRIIGC